MRKTNCDHSFLVFETSGSRSKWRSRFAQVVSDVSRLVVPGIAAFLRKSDEDN